MRSTTTRPTAPSTIIGTFGFPFMARHLYTSCHANHVQLLLRELAIVSGYSRSPRQTRIEHEGATDGSLRQQPEDDPADDHGRSERPEHRADRLRQPTGAPRDADRH